MTPLIRARVLRTARILGIALLATIAAGLARRFLLADLQGRIAWVTFYPAVVVASVYGGWIAGLLAAGLACVVAEHGWFLVGAYPLVKDSGDHIGMYAFLFNCAMIAAVAESARRANARAEAARDQAVRANRAKSAFLANMSHELRTPLNSVLGFSTILRRSPDVTPDQASLLETISKSGEHLLGLINNVLEMSKIESGHVALDEVPTDLHQVLQEIRSMMAARSSAKGLYLSLDLDPGLPRYVRMDAGKSRQVLVNLVGNAIKFTQAGGVTIRTAATVPAPATATEVRVRLRFEVEDTGPGIPPEDRERIFAPFVQGGNQPFGEAGTGLGLAICRQSVEAMKGTIGVRPAPTGGAVFFFEIPVATLEGEALPVIRHERQVVGLAPGEASRRLLIAEDQPENRLLLRRLLEPLGFEVREAVNGEEAVRIFAEWHPDLVWMDVRMPVLDGFGATRAIRRRSDGSQVKIVALTAHALEEERQDILAAGCDQCITKPFRDTEIFDALERHLGVRFQREREEGTERDERVTSTVSGEDLRALSPEVLLDLVAAVEALDAARAGMAINRIPDPELAARLLEMVENFRYGELLAALDEITKEKGRTL